MTVGIQEATASTWSIDPSHSEVGFSIKHMMITTVRGAFSDVSGTIKLDPTDVRKSSVQVQI
jgi:polyisoprenoid-binding protein YceI